jgi:hypothetical protein
MGKRSCRNATTTGLQTSCYPRDGLQWDISILVADCCNGCVDYGLNGLISDANPAWPKLEECVE